MSEHGPMMRGNKYRGVGPGGQGCSCCNVDARGARMWEKIETRREIEDELTAEQTEERYQNDYADADFHNREYWHGVDKFSTETGGRLYIPEQPPEHWRTDDEFEQDLIDAFVTPISEDAPQQWGFTIKLPPTP